LHEPGLRTVAAPIVTVPGLSCRFVWFVHGRDPFGKKAPVCLMSAQ
jgi:hypothetical protein